MMQQQLRSGVDICTDDDNDDSTEGCGHDRPC